MARKKPQSISLLGSALVGASQEASAEARKRKKDEEKKKKLFKGLKSGIEFFGNQILARKNENFLQQEDFYSRNALVDSNIKENQKHIDRWNNRTAYKTGEAAYWQDMAQTHIVKLPEYETWKANTKPADFNSYIYTESSKLAEKMKKNAESNYKEATARAARYGDNPKEAFKNEILKNKSDNIWEAISLPIVNMFVGNDERTPTQASIDAIEAKDGLADQGKVKIEDVKTIFEQTGNFELALQSAEELKEFRDTLGKGIENLERSTPTFGKPFNVYMPNKYGDSIQITAVERKLGGVSQGFYTLSGQNITEKLQNNQVSKRAGLMKLVEIQEAKQVFEQSISDKNYKVFQSFKDSEMSTVDDERKVDGLKNFDQQFFGKIAITSDYLTDTFGNTAGWSSVFSKKLASQMHIENLKLGYSKPLVGSGTFNSNTSLLAGDDHYDAYVALKALQTLNIGEGVTETLFKNNLQQNILNSKNVGQDSTYTPLQIKSSIRLAEELGLKTKTSSIQTERNLTTGANEAAVSKTTVVANMPPPPLRPRNRQAIKREDSASKAQRKEYKEVIQAQESFEYQQELVLTSLARANKTLNDIEPNQSGQLAGLVRAAEAKKKKADSLYTSYMKKYGEVN